jgi:hypothetical protein
VAAKIDPDEIVSQTRDWMVDARNYWRNPQSESPEKMLAIQTMAIVALTGMVAEHLNQKR